MVEAIVEYSFQVVLYSCANAQMMSTIIVGNVAMLSSFEQKPRAES